jgi:hypothetical protein
MQSMNEDTLRAIKRDNLKLNNLAQQLDLAVKYDIPAYTEIILGMPEETLESWKTGNTDLLEAGQHNQIDVFFTAVLKNSELNNTTNRLLYGIKKRKIEKYMVFSIEDLPDEETLSEDAEIVVSTNTMNQKDIISAYMYSWLVNSLHLSGYTQVVSKYCRNILNVPYKKFYDALYDLVRNDKKNPICPIFHLVQECFEELIYTGKITRLPINISHVQFINITELYNNKEKIIAMGIGLAKTFGPVPDDIEFLQKNFVFDSNSEFPVIFQASYNPISWINTPTQIKITNRLPKNFEPSLFSLVKERRRGGLKNKIEIL